LINTSAATSLEEGLEETLTIHRLGLMPYFKDSFRTTNGLESLNSQVEQRTGKVKRWRTSKYQHSKRSMVCSLIHVRFV
jgi:transposase-like protein